MTEIINEFNIFHFLPHNIIRDIRTFYVTARHGFTNYGYCVTNSDQVYCVGEQIKNVLFSDQNSNENYVLIHELCGKQIEEFFGSSDQMYARNTQNQIFGWG